LKFTDQQGNAVDGRNVFKRKGCSNCHGEDAKGRDVAPDLSTSNSLVSPIDMAQIMWNHAPVMEEKVTEKTMKWPEFSGSEMRDIYAFLKDLSNLE
jgi:mono/diheme cytochrome c family protein